MKISTQRYVLVLLSASLFMACGRPYATFQRSQPDRFITPQPTIAQVSTTNEVTTAPMPVVAASTADVQAVAQQFNEAVASNSGKVADNKKVQKRLARVQQLLATSRANAASTASTTPHKMTLLEKVMSKKISKQLHKKLAPKQAKANTTVLATGAVVVIIGLLLLLLASGTAQTIGAVAIIAGAIILLVGLF